LATSVVVAPSFGHGLVSTQQGIGATPGFDAVDDRRFWSAGRQEGALTAAAWKVSERGAGATMTVDIAANAGGFLVQGDAITHQGLYYVAPHGAVINLDATASHSTNPRIDSVFLRVRDNQHDGSTNNDALVDYVAGTATSGATLDNRTGAPALPSGAARLADILVPAASSSVTNANIRDRRAMANGAYYRGVSASNLAGSGGASVQTPTNCSTRLELSGVPVRASVRHGMINLGGSGVASYGIHVLLRVDTVTVTEFAYPAVLAGADDYRLHVAAGYSTGFVPTAGSRLVDFSFSLDNVAVASQTIKAPFELIIEELVGRV
jgi:hypothetical protein